MPEQPFTVVVPVKSSSRGKSRLLLPAGHRATIARAMALDTVTAIARVAPVVVVAEDSADALALTGVKGVRVHLTHAVGLNEAILDGVRWWLTTPDRGDRNGGEPGVLERAGTAVAVLPADIPGLDPDDLLDALRAAAGYRGAVVADRQGTGTTLLTACPADQLQPRYGTDSFRRHVESGAQPLDCPAESSLRMDIDEPQDLLADLGPLTRAALAAAQQVASPGRVGGVSMAGAMDISGAPGAARDTSPAGRAWETNAVGTVQDTSPVDGAPGSVHTSTS